jgi:hypothetical protein
VQIVRNYDKKLSVYYAEVAENLMHPTESLLKNDYSFDLRT